MPHAKIALLGIAAGSGAGRPGAEDGPRMLREAGLVERLARGGTRVEDLGDVPGVYETFHVAPAFDVKRLGNVLQVNRHTHDCVLGLRRREPDTFLLTVGGDHSLEMGVLAGLSDSCRRLGLLWIDAHGDFNTPATSPTGHAHGMCLAVACGHGHRELRTLANRDPLVREDDVYLFGVRDLDRGERDALVRSRVRLSEMRDWRPAGLVDSVLAAAEQLAADCDHVHLTFDIDVVDVPHVPGTGTPVPGGLTDDEARAVLSALGQLGAVHSADFVEYNPHLDEDGRTGRLTLDLIDTFVNARNAN